MLQHPYRQFARLPLILLLAVVPTISSGLAASTKLWNEYREAAQKARKENDLETAARNYEFALTEADEAFKGTDLRYLNTAIEAGEYFERLRAFPAATGRGRKHSQRSSSHPRGGTWEIRRYGI